MLVIDDIDSGPLALQPDHRTYEIRAVRSVQPGGPHYIAAVAVGDQVEYRPFARELAATVGGARCGRIIFLLRLSGRTSNT